MALVITGQSIQDLVRVYNKIPAVTDLAIPGLVWAAQCAAALEAERVTAVIDGPLRVAHFLAQIAHETGGFRSLVESTRYTKPEILVKLFRNVHGLEHAQRLVAAGPVAIGNTIYANKLGNGGVDSGDGYRFRGRGFLMNTGRAHYLEVKLSTGVDVIADPDLLGRPPVAAKAAAVFWRDQHLNAAADADSVDEATRIVNGAKMVGAEARREWAKAAKTVWT